MKWKSKLMKLKICISVEDYFDYVGTNPLYSIERRIKESLPSEIANGSIIAFKQINKNSTFNKWYRVHLITDITQDQFNKMENFNNEAMHKYEELLYKQLDC